MAFSADINTSRNIATVFAPTDNAFATLFTSMNVTSDQFLADAKTLNGKVMLNGTATVVTPDVQVTGQVVVHVIDGVLIPVLPSGVAPTMAATAS